MATRKRKRPQQARVIADADAPPARSTRSSRTTTATAAQLSAGLELEKRSRKAEAMRQKRTEEKDAAKKRQEYTQKKDAQKQAKNQALRQKRAALKEQREQLSAAPSRRVTWRNPLEEPGRMVAPESEHVGPPTVDDWEPTLSSSPQPLESTFTEQHTIVTPTSSPSRDFDYEVATKFAVYVNGSRKVKDTVTETTRCGFSSSDLEPTVESLIASPASTVDSRPFEYIGRTVRAKVIKPRAIWQDFNLQDFRDFMIEILCSKPITSAMTNSFSQKLTKRAVVCPRPNKVPFDIRLRYTKRELDGVIVRRVRWQVSHNMTSTLNKTCNVIVGMNANVV